MNKLSKFLRFLGRVFRKLPLTDGHGHPASAAESAHVLNLHGTYWNSFDVWFVRAYVGRRNIFREKGIFYRPGFSFKRANERYLMNLYQLIRNL